MACLGGDLVGEDHGVLLEAHGGELLREGRHVVAELHELRVGLGAGGEVRAEVLDLGAHGGLGVDGDGHRALAAAVLLFIRGGADGLSAATAVVTAPSAVGGYAQSGVLQVGASLAALAYYLFL